MPIVRSAAYSCALLTWVVYLSKAPAAEVTPNAPRHDIESWNRALLELLA